MNASQTSTFVHPPLIPYYGVTAFSDTDNEAMDVNADGQPLAGQHQAQDMMDTTLDGPQNVPDKGKVPEAKAESDAPATKSETTATSEPTDVLERPREGGDDGDRGSPMQMQMRKTPHCLFSQPFSRRAWVDTGAMW